MDNLLALLPVGEVTGLLFKTVFLDRLPADVRARVQGAAEHQDCRQLAAAANVIWRARNQKQHATVAAVPEEHVQELTDTVAAEGGRGKGRSGPSGRMPAQPGQRTPYLCYKHARYCNAAWNCEDPSRCSAASIKAEN